MGLDVGRNGKGFEPGDQGRGTPELTGVSIRKFELGQVVQTANSMGQLNRKNVLIALGRHSRGDWGDLEKDDLAENEFSLREGFRLCSDN